MNGGVQDSEGVVGELCECGLSTSGTCTPGQGQSYVSRCQIREGWVGVA